MDIQKFLNAIFKKRDGAILQKKTSAIKAGIICPRCGNCTMYYDGLLNLRCKVCGYLTAGSHT